MSAPAADRPLRRDAEQNRRRLLDAAAEVFAEHGLEAGVDEIARVAGVGMGTLYRRFPTKDALIEELVRELLVEMLQAARDAHREPDGGGLVTFLYAIGTQQASGLGFLPRVWSTPLHTQLQAEI